MIKKVHNDNVKIDNWSQRMFVVRCKSKQIFWMGKITMIKRRMTMMLKRSKLSEEFKMKRKNACLNYWKMLRNVIPNLTSRLNKPPPKNQILEWRNEDSKSIEHVKNDIVNNLAGKHPHDIYGQYINDELKFKFYKKQRDNLEFLKKRILCQEKHYNVRQCCRFRNTKFSIASYWFPIFPMNKNVLRKRKWYRTIYGVWSNV